MTATNYTVSFANANAHYAHVKLDFSSKGKEFVDFKVPVWTPGSYKVREFSNAFENVKAEGLNVERVDKNTWRIFTKGADNVSLTYDVFSFVVSVRQTYVDQNYAFLHGVSAFGYIAGLENEEILLQLEPLAHWKNVEVALEQLKMKGWAFRADNYDLLADSPIALGNFETTDYESGKVPHRVVMIGEGNYDLGQIKTDFKKLNDFQVELMGDHPSKKYVHFVYNVDNGGGGLEHLNCQTSMIPRWNYTDPAKYKSFLGLIAHEYFHLWNVKRIRPVELGPFDYDKEVYTDMLWVAEGITSYYDDFTLFKTGYYSEEEYLKIISWQINRFENTPGKDVMSLNESSKLAWVKSYMPKENSANTEVSYYNKGMLVATLLNLTILQKTAGKKSLDNVMRSLYARYKKSGTGFTFAEFLAICNKESGADLANFFELHLNSTQPLNYTETFAAFGLKLTDENSDKKNVYSGASSKTEGGKTILTTIKTGSPAEKAGLSINDEIVSINGWRLSGTLEETEKRFNVDEITEVSYARDGKMYTTELQFLSSPIGHYALSVADKENKLLKCWMYE